MSMAALASTATRAQTGTLRVPSLSSSSSSPRRIPRPNRRPPPSSMHPNTVVFSAASADEPARPPLPPFTADTALAKVKAAEAAWNRQDVDAIAAAYSVDSEWRNRAEFVRGRDNIKDFLRRKWDCELQYVLRKYLWAFHDNRIAVCFEYEYVDPSGQWHRAYGNENWEFDAKGYMRKRIASINEAPIDESERRISVPEGAEVAHNSWLTEQGLSDTLEVQFPLSNGNLDAY
uniref:Uncharacterized protein n=1 Tax=Mantoniella antarctica TaxID=81844 RepID=A0A7S0XGF5_9CHLO|mmetsp:Transcript_5247/g.13186  ORF Transcript_5247/g.13186 Transcript_5247/m.13186 type:complete len:232 (+) Transcript_5247:71-766(+)